MRTLILSVVVLSLIPFSLYASARSDSGGLPERVAELEAQVEVLAAALQEAQEILQYVHVETEEIKGVTGPHWIIEGVNLHVRSGSETEATNEFCVSSTPGYPNCEILTGLGNLIIGYNEQVGVGPPRPREIRTGSHNLVVGPFHSYSSYGGFVAGDGNKITGAFASVAGGEHNEASGPNASVSGGHRNLASGGAASVSGGQEREAPDNFNWGAGELFEPN
jgi:hypothetical protein